MNSLKNTAFIRFFTNFPQLFLAGLMFSVPLAVSAGVFAVIGNLIGVNSIIVLGLGVVPAFPMYAGLVMVVRKIAVEKKKIALIPTFLSAVKENLKLFLIHGLVVYLLTVCSYFAMIYYYTLAKAEASFGYVLTFYAIFTLLLLVMMFYVPIMSVTYELKLRDIYKNAFLLVFGKILRNVIALALLVAVTVIAILMIIMLKGIWLYIAFAFIVIFYPMLFCYIINTVIAQGLQESVGSFTEPVIEREESVDEQVALENADSDSDYVFVNGKMIKNDKNNTN